MPYAMRTGRQLATRLHPGLAGGHRPGFDLLCQLLESVAFEPGKDVRRAPTNVVITTLISHFSAVFQ